MSTAVTRRDFARMAGGVLTSLVFAPSCGGHAAEAPGDGRFSARPRRGVKTAAAGSRALGLASDRDAVLQMPQNAGAAPVPLLVLLHGAGGSAAGVLRRVGTAPASAGVAVLAPESRRTTWDAIRGDFDGDVAFIDRALERVFETVAVDPARIAIAGFSDGATYAVSLGIINGDLFPRVIAFSAGFIVPGAAHGKPSFFVSHGTNDDILPIDRCGRVVAAGLRKRGYEVTFREFDGGHEVPPAVAAEALSWLTGRRLESGR